MYVIAKKGTKYLKKGDKYKIINADTYEYEIEYATNRSLWIGKDDTENFEYHV